MVVCVECLPADKPWDVVSATRRSSGVAPRACVRVCAGAAESLHTYIHHTALRAKGAPQREVTSYSTLDLLSYPSEF